VATGTYRSLLVVLLLGIALFRAGRLTADPPDDLCYGSLAVYTDEGYKTYHARNMALFGAWNWNAEDQYTYWVRNSPASLRLHAAWFELLGRADLAAARGLHLLLGLLTLLLWALTVRRQLGPQVALLSTAILGLTFVGGMYARMVFLENLLNLCAVLLLFLLARRRPGPWRVLLALAVVLAGMLVKVTFLFVLASAGLGGLYLAVEGELRRRRVAPERRAVTLRKLLAGLGIGALALYLLSQTLPALLGSVLPLYARSPLASPVSLLRNLVYAQFTVRAPFLVLLALLGAAQVLRRSLLQRPGAPRLLVLAAFWLLAGLLGVSAFEGNGDRIRYYLFLLPPASLLAAWTLVSALPERWLLRSAAQSPAPATPPEDQPAALVAGLPRAGRGLRLAGAFALVVFGVGLFLQILDQDAVLRVVRAAGAAPGLGARAVAFWPALATGAAVLTLLVLLAAGWLGSARRQVVLALGLGWIGLNGLHYGAWMLDPPRRLEQARAAVAELLPPDAVLAGQWAPTAALDTRLRVLHLHYSMNLKDGRLARLAPTHLLVSEDRPEENEILEQEYPGLLRPENLLLRMRIHRYGLRLYRLDWTKAGSRPQG